jgi:voltage-gated potassium channel
MRLGKWERRTDGPLTVLAVAFLGCYAWPILQPDLDHGLRSLLSLLTFAIWAVFIADYLVRVSLADDRRGYVRRHLFDVVMLVLPMLRPLRALRVLVALGRMDRTAQSTFHGRAAVYIAGAVPLVVFVAALASLDAERSSPDANITTFGDALWWACTTITTVGYGDYFPVTTQGRFIAVALMVAGIAMLGVVTAALASWFIERLGRVEAAERATQRDLDVVLAELRSLRRELDHPSEAREVR